MEVVHQINPTVHSAVTATRAFVKPIEHQGVALLYFCFESVTEEDDGLARIAEARELVTKQSSRTLRTLIDVTDSRFTTRIIQELRQLAADYKPFVVASAVVGVGEVKAMILKGISKMTGRTFYFAKTLDEAKDWLAQQH